MLSKLFQSDEFRKAWKDWQQHRREIRHKLTPLTEQRQLRKLEKFPVATAISMIERSIENGWCGLFEITEDKKDGKDWLEKARRQAENYSRSMAEEMERTKSDGVVPLAGLATAFAKARLNPADVPQNRGGI